MFSKKYWLKSKLSKFLTQIEKFDQKQDFRNFWPKFKFLENFGLNRDFQKFWQKSKFLENFDRNREFRNYWAKLLKYFEIFLPKSWFFFFFLPKSKILTEIKILDEIDVFWTFWPKSRFSELVTEI